MKKKCASLSKGTLIKMIERKQKQLNFYKKENEMLQNILSLIPGNVYWKDPTGKFLGCNRNVAKILGFNHPHEVIGKTPTQFKSLKGALHAHLAEKIDQQVLTSTQEVYTEEKGINQSQQPAVYLTKKLPLYNKSNQLMGVLGVSFDITDRKRIEEDLKVAKRKAETSNRAKSQFLAVVNHELRTPLTSIVSLVEFLQQKNLSRRDRSNIINNIENCARHLLGLVTEVLDFSQLETGELAVRTDTIHLQDLLHEVHSITQPLAHQKKLALRCQIDSNVPQFIRTDQQILKQIIINLVSNAIKFTDKGSVTIHVSQLQSTSTRFVLKISVLDSGQGIPAEKLKLIFEPFQQLENAYTRQSSRAGTGLGLTIVEKLSALINVNIKVTSELNKGSVFSLVGTFETSQPTVSPTPPPFEHQPRCKTKKARPLKKTSPVRLLEHRILLVEDDPIIQYVHQKIFNDLGYALKVVSNGKDAIQLAEDHSIIFIDISLPDISGFDVIKTIRKKTKKQITIIVLTVYTGKEERKACLDAGANEFISKPISKTQLKKLLNFYLKN